MRLLVDGDDMSHILTHQRERIVGGQPWERLLIKLGIFVILCIMRCSVDFVLRGSGDLVHNIH